MDITIRLSPRKVERIIFILVVIALVVSNVYFYNKQGSKETETTESIEETTQVTETQEAAGAEPEQQEQTQPSQGQQQTPQNQQVQQNQTNQNNTQQTGAAGACAAAWKCKTPYYKGHQKTDCSWEDLEACVNGCINGQCNVTTS